MCFGELNHFAELGTECVAGSEFVGLHGKSALLVNVDIGHGFGRCIGLAHACSSWSVGVTPYSYLNPVGTATALGVSQQSWSDVGGAR